MEIKIEKLSQLKVGDITLIDNPLLGEDTAVVFSIHDTYKYPITDSEGNKKRSLGRVDGSIKYVTADEEGCKGDEMIKTYCLMSTTAGDYNFDEDTEFEKFNMRKISKDHPKYDDSISNDASQLSQMLNDMGKMFGE